jgi:flagellar biosynthesis chaperone FliJ
LLTIADRSEQFISELHNVGMDTDGYFENTFSPAEYIQHLENEIECYSRDLAQATNRVYQLETRTLMSFVEDVNQALKAANQKVTRISIDLRKAEEELKERQDKLKAWNLVARG